MTERARDSARSRRWDPGPRSRVAPGFSSATRAPQGPRRRRPRRARATAARIGAPRARIRRSVGRPRENCAVPRVCTLQSHADLSRHRRRRLSRFPPLRRLLERGHSVICVDNLETGSLKNISTSGATQFRFEMLDITSHYEIDEPVDFVYHMASPASPDRLRAAAAAHAEGRRLRHPQHARPGEGQARALPDRLDLRGLRRPARPPPARDLLGQRQPDRPARRLRRGQALRRGADDGLSAPAGRGHRDRPHLQHLRAADAAARRPRDPDLPAPGAHRQAADGVRRRLPDALLLLRRRPRSAG